MKSRIPAAGIARETSNGRIAFGQMAECLLWSPREVAFDSVADFVDTFRKKLFESTAIWTDLPVPAGPLIPPSRPLAAAKSTKNWELASRILGMAVDDAKGAGGGVGTGRSRVYLQPALTMAWMEWHHRHPVLERDVDRLLAQCQIDEGYRRGRPWRADQLRVAIPFFVFIGPPPAPGAGHASRARFLDDFLLLAQESKKKRLKGPSETASVFAGIVRGSPGVEWHDDDARLEAREVSAMGEVIASKEGWPRLLAMLYLNLMHAHLGLLWLSGEQKRQARRAVFGFVHERAQQVLHQAVLEERDDGVADVAATLSLQLARMRQGDDDRFAPDGWPQDLPAPFQRAGEANLTGLLARARSMLQFNDVPDLDHVLGAVGNLARDTAGLLTHFLRAPEFGLLDAPGDGMAGDRKARAPAEELCEYASRCRSAAARLETRGAGSLSFDPFNAALRARRVSGFYSFLWRCRDAVLAVTRQPTATPPVRRQSKGAHTNAPARPNPRRTRRGNPR